MKDKKQFFPNKFKPTFDVLKNIEDITTRLPQIPSANKLGGILRSKECIFDGSSKTIISKAQMINHKVELISAYRKFGTDGISQYLTFVSNYQKQLDDVIKKQEIDNEDPYKENIRQFNSQI